MKYGLFLIRKYFVLILLISLVTVTFGKKRVSEVSDIDALIQNYRRMQFLAPPVQAGNVLEYDVGYVVIDVDEKNWPNKLIKGLVSVTEQDGSIIWPFSVWEDNTTYRTVIINGNGECLYNLSAPKKYDPCWVANYRFNLSATTEERKKKYAPVLSPSRIRVSGKFVLKDHPKAKKYLEKKRKSYYCFQ